MAWVLLVVAGLLEVGWSIGMKFTDGFTRLWPSVFTGAGIVASMLLLSYAAKTLPIGTAYGVWVGIGAAGAAVVGMVGAGRAGHGRPDLLRLSAAGRRGGAEGDVRSLTLRPRRMAWRPPRAVPARCRMRRVRAPPPACRLRRAAGRPLPAAALPVAPAVRRVRRSRCRRRSGSPRRAAVGGPPVGAGPVVWAAAGRLRSRRASRGRRSAGSAGVRWVAVVAGGRWSGSLGGSECCRTAAAVTLGARLELRSKSRTGVPFSAACGELRPRSRRVAAAVDAGQAQRPVQRLLGAGVRVLAHARRRRWRGRGCSPRTRRPCPPRRCRSCRRPGGPAACAAVPVPLVDDALQHRGGGVGGLAADGLAGCSARAASMGVAVLGDLLDDACTCRAGRGWRGWRTPRSCRGRWRWRCRARWTGTAARSGVFSGMPRSIAVCLTLAGPTSTAICAYTELTELVGGLADGDGAVGALVLVLGGVRGRRSSPDDGALVGAVVEGVGGDRAAVLGAWSRSRRRR